MSIISDLLCGITPRKRKEIEEQERRQREEREKEEAEHRRRIEQEKFERMKSAEPTIQMAKWVSDALREIHSSHFVEGISITITRDAITLYNIPASGRWDDLIPFGGISFGCIGYEDIPLGSCRLFCTVLIHLVYNELGSQYVFEYLNDSSAPRKCIYKYRVTQKNIVREESPLKNWKI